MKGLVEFITEAKRIQDKLEDDDTLKFGDADIIQGNLNYDLGYTKNRTFYVMRKPGDELKNVNVQFWNGELWYSTTDPTGRRRHNVEQIGIKLDGKITYGEIKQKVIEIYKEHYKEFEEEGWKIPDKLRELMKNA